MLSVPQALQRVLDVIVPLEPRSEKVREALGSVLAEKVVAAHPMPRFDNSAMDGYAVRSIDIPGPATTLAVTGEVRAGDPGDLEVAEGTAVRIMTGAAVPAGADAVVPVEVTESSGDAVTVNEVPKAGQHIRRAGEDFSAGTILMDEGVELGPGECALLASVGHSPVLVRSAPRVAIVVTGDELVEPEAEPGPGQVRDSNSIALEALVLQAGATPILLRRVGDDLSSTIETFRVAAQGADLVVSSGGVAVGRYDFVKDAIAELGEIDMWRVAMQPGKPVVLGRIGDKPFLGLPGNPVSIHVSFEQFVRPAIRKLLGCTELLRPRVAARLTETITKKPGRLHFVRVRLTATGDGWEATPTGPQGSHIQSSLVGVHGVAIFDASLERIESGETVSVEVWSLPGRKADG